MRRQDALQEYAARMHGEVSASPNSVDDPGFGPAPIEQIERKLDVFHLRMGERLQRFGRRLYRDAKFGDSALFQMLNQTPPHRTAKRGYVARTVKQKTIELRTLERRAGCHDAGVDSVANAFARCTHFEFGQRAEFGDGNRATPGERFAKPLFGIAIASCRIELRHARIGRTAHQAKRRFPSGLARTIGRAIGETQLHGAHDELGRMFGQHGPLGQNFGPKVRQQGKCVVTTMTASHWARNMGDSLEGLMTRQFISILACLLLLAGCAGIAEPTPSASQLAAVKASLFKHIHEERLRLNGEAKPLKLDAELSAAAQAHSEAMAKQRAFDTGGANENIAIQKLAANPAYSGYVAEISAMQYFNPAFSIDPDALARGFVAIWLNSPDHRSNIAFGSFEKTGIGIAVTGNQIYAAELFGADLRVQAP